MIVVLVRNFDCAFDHCTHKPCFEPEPFILGGVVWECNSA